jgi:hypothetical protein
LNSYRISQVELGFLMLISTNLFSFHNICMKDDNTPHTADSIGESIGETRQNVKLKLDRLEKMNILARVTFPDMRHLKEVLVVNPHILRKGKDFNEYLLNVFYDFAKKD